MVLWGASERHLAAYRELGMRAVCVGEEAFVDPRQFTLEGRPVRKLRQSVHRVRAPRMADRRPARAARSTPQLEAEIDTLERGGAPASGACSGLRWGWAPTRPRSRPNDLYLLARSPEGELGAVMRFVSHCGKLSLDTMRRVGETPNGLNEALVCRALKVARERGVTQVSLNYAGLAHLVRGEPSPRRAGCAGAGG